MFREERTVILIIIYWLVVGYYFYLYPPQAGLSLEIVLEAEAARRNLLDQSEVAVTTTTSVAAAFCSSCTPSDADGVCESFENTDCTWADTDGGSECTIARSGHTLTSATSCTDGGTDSALFTLTNGGAELCLSTIDFGSAIGTVMVYGHINVNSTSLASGQDTAVISYATAVGGSDRNYQLVVDNDGGDLKWQLDYRGTEGYRTVRTAAANFAVATWYPFKLEWVSGTSFNFYMDFNNDGDFSDTVNGDAEHFINDSTNILSRTAQYLMFGACTIVQNPQNLVVEYDLIKVDDDTAISNYCSR